ncbi:uncharacterized protein K489DRAFT_248682 [Dissoconium aciculare CBS 342.82]|uniref:Uncharacterized protein n=1 Tax=Dissoconium aciculare CBS 342.82 TaxID=1314786 RepID=A0A6J3M0A8_9PEZI|nr:uncharacterized protein K489DRAFT_248682 [Dissoconium aciculare CBS 342.82]KAF1821470.1 hypothetical protein K489DRAFT_248682 [Dissoconium aciculare CBS 342.82]
MARHRSGCGSGHALEILQACEIADPRGFDDPITLLSVEPAIVNDELNLRIQQWIVFASRHLEKSVELQQLSICNHFNNDDDTLGPILECKIRHRETRQGYATCHPYLRCPRCHIEFNIRTRDLGVDGSAVIITKWVRLGRGLSPTDPHWHLNAWESAFMQRNVPEQATDDGSLHARFERQATMGIDALFPEYMSLLRGKSYRRALLHSYKSSDPDLGDVWIRSPRVEGNAHYYNNYPYAIY